MAEHYPSDVISGALLGILSSAFLLPIFERIFKL
jgi:membrane-associated phospholipid phosphatase